MTLPYIHVDHVENMRITRGDYSCCFSKIGESISDIQTALVRASKSAGVSIVTDYITSVSQAGVTFVAASIEGVEKIPSTAYGDGVDVGFAYYSSKSCDIPEGFYTLRIRAKVECIGEVDSPMEFLDRNGRVVATSRGKMDVFSLTVPENPPFVGNIITAKLQFDEDMKPRELGLALQPTLLVDTWCSNGNHRISFPDEIVIGG